MRRRTFSIGCAGAALSAVAPLRLAAQPKATAVIGSLNANSPGPFEVPVNNAWLSGLGETGFVQRQNLRVEDRWALAQYDQLPRLAADLVGRKVDIIRVGSLPGARVTVTTLGGIGAVG